MRKQGVYAMSQLTQYIIALSNLYGMVHTDKVVEIYNSQNDDKIDLADVEEILSEPPKELDGSMSILWTII